MKPRRRAHASVWEIVDAAPDLRRLLEHLIGDECPIPQCGEHQSRLISLESKDHRANPDSCVLLCAAHARLALEGNIDVELLRTIRRLLRINRVAKGASGGAKILETRTDYLRTIKEAMEAGSSQLRIVYVGPFPLHPEWYFALNDAATELPNMDRVAHRLANTLGPDAKLIFRNNPRYIEKVRELLPSSLIQPLKEELQAEIERLRILGDAACRIRCMETGTLHIPVILDDLVIAAARTSPNQPIDGGLMIREKAQITWEAAAYDRLFNSIAKTQDEELEALEIYVAGI